jgi:hypothetical protein
MEQESPLPEKRFSNPQDELSFLREQVAQKERELAEGRKLKEGNQEKKEKSEESIARQIDQYKKVSSEQVLHPNYQMPREEVKALVLDLAPESHDAKMSELLGIMQEKGVKNALAVAEALNNPHITDDFERFLVAYIKGGQSQGMKGLKERDPLFKSLHMTLYEIALPEKNEKDQPKTLKELISSMEQFYAGMLSISSEKDMANYFTLELAVSNHSDEFIFYAGVPDSRKDLFEKQVLSIFHNAKISEKKDDYNIFNEAGAAVVSVGELSKSPVFPIKTYDEFDHDPLNVILNSFSKIDRDGEGAAIQLVLSGAGETYNKRYKSALDQIYKGEKVKYAIDMPETFLEHVGSIAREFVKESPKKKEGELPRVDEIATENIKKKISSPIVNVGIRLVASAKDEQSANEIIQDLESAFNQFENSNGNKLTFNRLKRSHARKAIHDFSFRTFPSENILPLAIKEVTTLFHFPSTISKSAPQLKVSKAGSAPAPMDLPQTGVLLGTNINRNISTKVFMNAEDRLRHFYVIGQTGTGKTTLLKNMIAQDIANGEGVCMIDPHGSDIQDVLANVPKERYEDVIYFDPSQTARPMALNMLEFDRNFPEQKTFVVNELFSIFQKLYGAVPESMGPMFEQYFRNATMLVIEDPDTGCTLLDVSRVMSNKAFRDMKISHCKNPIVVQFWKEIAEKAGGEASLANIVPYITSKFDVFLANDIMRPIISQEKSSFNFREVIDGKKILLVNLSKGRLGDINSHLIGLILVGKILMAALSRVDSLHLSPPIFYLYIDEFQNITTPSIATILSEARKYKLSLHIAHQFIAQLEEKIKDAVFGNVGSMASFRVGSEDAEFLAKQFEPVFTASDLMNLDNRNAYLKMLVNGRPVKPFNIETMPPPAGNRDILEKLKQLSYLKYGRDREDIQEEIMKKYQKSTPDLSMPRSL